MKKGFTLIELTATLLLVAIMGVSLVISLLPMSEALMQVRANASAAQKARLAMSRITAEFITITNVLTGGSSAISYRFLTPDGLKAYAVHAHTLVWGGAGTDLVLRDDADGRAEALTDDVADFQLTYDVGPPLVIHVALQSEVGVNAFSNSVVPRDIQP